MEIWDGYLADGRLAGVDLVRGEPIPDGLYFLAVEILVRHVDGDYLLMQRDYDKPAFGGMFEATAGGAAKKGEAPYTAALRELLEETGIRAEKLLELKHMTCRKMICYQYLCVTDCDKKSITLQKGETISYKWLSEAEFIEFVNSEDIIPTQKERHTEYFKRLGYMK